MLRPLLHSVRSFIFLGAITGLASCRPAPAAEAREEDAWIADHEPAEAPWGFIDTQCTLIIPPAFDDVGPFAGGMATACQGGRWGFLDRSGRWVIPPRYRSAWTFHEGLARVATFDGEQFFINDTGHEIRSPDWQADDDFSEGLARVKQGDLVGFIDSTGGLEIEPGFERASQCVNGFIIVTSGQGQGILDRHGVMRLPADQDKIRRIGESDHFLVLKDRQWRILDDAMQPVVVFGRDASVVAEGDWAFVLDDDHPYFFRVSSGDTTSTFSFTRAEPLGLGYWQGRTPAGWVLFKPPARVLNRGPFQQLNRFEDHMAVYLMDDGWGFLDTTGRALTPAVFGLAWDYKEGFARAAFSDGLGLLDRNQKLACRLPAGVIDLRDFREGLAPIQLLTR